MRKMKIPLFLALSISVYGAEIKMNDGSVITGEVSEIIPAQIVVKTESGISRIPVDLLSPESKEILLSQPSKIPPHKITQIPTKPTPPPAPPAARDNLEIVELGAREIKRSGKYAYVAWQVKLRNNTEIPMRLSVYFKFVDRKKFELEKDLDTNVLINAGEERTVGSQIMIDLPVWEQVDSYIASTKVR